MLECDVERSELLAEEAELLANLDAAAGKDTVTSEAGTSAAAERLQFVSTRLQEIGAEQAVAKGASILAGLSFDAHMQKRATKTFSGGEPRTSSDITQLAHHTKWHGAGCVAGAAPQVAEYRHAMVVDVVGWLGTGNCSAVLLRGCGTATRGLSDR